MCVLSFDDGMAAASWYAWLALRSRVSMSAIGSVIVMGGCCLSHRGSARSSARASRRSVVHRWVVTHWPRLTPGRPRCRDPRRAERVAGGTGVLHQLDL